VERSLKEKQLENLGSHIEMQTHAFDLGVNACRGLAIGYTHTDTQTHTKRKSQMQPIIMSYWIVCSMRPQLPAVYERWGHQM